MSMVSLTNELHSQAQIIAELWVWRSCYSHLEKILGKNHIFLTDFPEAWVWTLIVFYIGPTDQL